MKRKTIAVRMKTLRAIDSLEREIERFQVRVPSRNSFRRVLRPNASLDFTVPIGISRTAATWASGISSRKCRTSTARLAGLSAGLSRSSVNWSSERPQPAPRCLRAPSRPRSIRRPALALLQMTKRRPARDAECPGAKELRLLEPIQLARHDDEDVLQDVVGVIRPDEPGDIATQRRLHAAQQQLQRLAVVALRSQYPLRFLYWRWHAGSLSKRQPNARKFDRCVGADPPTSSGMSLLAGAVPDAYPLQSPRRREGWILWSKLDGCAVVAGRGPSGAGLRGPRRARLRGGVPLRKRISPRDAVRSRTRRRAVACRSAKPARSSQASAECAARSLAPPVCRGSTVSLRTRHCSPARYPAAARSRRREMKLLCALGTDRLHSATQFHVPQGGRDERCRFCGCAGSGAGRNCLRADEPDAEEVSGRPAGHRRPGQLLRRRRAEGHRLRRRARPPPPGAAARRRPTGPCPSRSPSARCTCSSRFRPRSTARGWPVIMVHGSTHTGACLEATPDGREGWYPYFVRNGVPSYVVDQAGRGRSGFDQSVHARRRGAARARRHARRRPTLIPSFGRITDNGAWTAWFGHLVPGGLDRADRHADSARRRRRSEPEARRLRARRAALPARRGGCACCVAHRRHRPGAGALDALRARVLQAAGAERRGDAAGLDLRELRSRRSSRRPTPGRRRTWRRSSSGSAAPSS